VPGLDDILRLLSSPIRCFVQWLRAWTKPNRTQLAAGVAADLVRTRDELILENALLRQQLIVLERQVERPQLTWRDRGIMVFLSSWLRAWRQALLIVQPDTVLRWHRDLYRRVWRWKSKAKNSGGRPWLSAEKVSLIRRIAGENRLWGAERIRGELLKLGIGVAKRTVQKYMKGVRPTALGGQTWRTFLRNHAAGIWACDLLQTYDLLFRSVFVFVIIELGSRRVVHFHVTRHPTDGWLAQQLRQATPFGAGPNYLIRDNDRKYGEQFDHVARGTGIEVLLTPVEAPRANAFCERFLGSLRRECLDHLLVLSERQLYRSVGEYVDFYNRARPHQGIDQHIPCVLDSSAPGYEEGRIVSWPVLGGLHHDYRRAA
jgi:putative transposase